MFWRKGEGVRGDSGGWSWLMVHSPATCSFDDMAAALMTPMPCLLGG